MEKLNKVKDKLMGIEIEKSWIYLLYIYLLLPAALFLLAWVLRDSGFGTALGLLFHNYGLFIANPIPGTSLTGYVGLAIGIFFIVTAIMRKDKQDVALSVAIFAADVLYFYFQINYLLIPFIKLV